MIISCKENVDKSLVKLNNENNIGQNKILFFEFPDTVAVSKVIKGKLRYNTSLKNSNFDERYIFLHIMTNQEKEDVPLDEMIKIDGRLVYEDTIGNGWFPFEAVFTKSGKSTLHSVVEDIIVLDNQVKGNKVEMTSTETIIAKDVHVQEPNTRN